MRRALSLVVIALLLFAGAVLVGSVLASRVWPERLRAQLEQRLSSAFEMPVRVGRAHTALRFGLVIEAQAVSAPKLQIERLLARVDLAALLRGEPRVDWLVVEGAVLRLGDPEPAPGTEAPAEPNAPLQAAARALDRLAGFLAAHPLPVERVQLRASRVELQTSDPTGPVLTGLEGTLRRRWLRPGTSLAFTGRLEANGVEHGELRLSGHLQPELALVAKFEDLDLAAAQRWVAGSAAPWQVAGRVWGRVGWNHSAGGPHRFLLELAAKSLTADAPHPGGLRARLPSAELEAELEASPERLRLVAGRLTQRDAEVSMTGSVELPARGSAMGRLRLASDELDVRSLPALAGRFWPAAGKTLARTLDSVTSGRIGRAVLELRAPAKRWRRLAASALRARPGELSLEASLRNAVVRVGVDEQLEGLSAELRFTGDELVVHAARAQLRGSRLPRLDASVRGLAQLADQEAIHCVPPKAVAPLHGRGQLWEWLASRRGEAHEPRWQQVKLEADWILHPALLCSLERVAAELRPVSNGFEWELTRGVWAGIPVTAVGSYHTHPAEAVAFRVDLGLAWEPVGPYPESGPWAQGRFAAAASGLGAWRIRGAAGGFRADHHTLALTDTRIDLDPAGGLLADVELGLGVAGRLPYRAKFQIPPLELRDLAAAAGLSPDLSGTLVGAGTLEGALHLGLPPLVDARGLMSLHARDGEIQRRVPPVLAIAAAADRLNPLASRDRLPYRAIDVVARIADGKLRSETFILDGPALRLMASGDIGMQAPFEIDAQVAVHFFRTLDAVIQRVPLLNRVLGADENLVSAYFSLAGPWRKPTAKLMMRPPVARTRRPAQRPKPQRGTQVES